MIALVSCTNRTNSNTLRVVRYFKKILDDKGVQNVILDLSQLPVDFIHSALYENCGKNVLFNDMQKIIEQADSCIFVVPEYNASFPGVLKSFIDGLPYPSILNNKRAALVGVSTGPQGGSLALSHLTDILNYLGMDTLPLKIKLAFIHKNLENENITNSLYQKLIDEQITKLMDGKLVKHL
jgi:chromate reductase, NAD(P)H dehydrogenase (quinone)